MLKKPNAFLKNKVQPKTQANKEKTDTGNSKFKKRNPDKVSINNQIKALEMRVIDHQGKNLGILDKEEALKIAREAKLDLIEITNATSPPVCKIADYGKWSYEKQKRLKEIKDKQIISETKNIQFGITTDENDLLLKSKQAAEWLRVGHRIKVELKLRGREKYLEEKFLKERLNKILAIIPAEYKIADPIKKTPKGFAVTLEKVK